jgi:hypothetical protein
MPCTREWRAVMRRSRIVSFPFVTFGLIHYRSEAYRCGSRY